MTETASPPRASNRSWRRPVAAALALVALAALAYVGYRTKKGLDRAAEMNRDVLPAFEDPAPGARAPGYDLLGVEVGRTTLDDVNALIEARGLSCQDTSIRALMRNKRMEKKAEVEAALARGESIDGITGASLVNYKSKKERNPQVRLSCEGTPSTKVPGRARAPSEGRVLFVFDSPTHPLRHVSYRRKHADPVAALNDIEDTFAALHEKLGPATERVRELPPRPDEGPPAFVNLHSTKRNWMWVDLKVQATVMKMGKTGIDVYEAAEVPWPVRADAPADPR